MSVRGVPKYMHGISNDGIPMSRREILFELRCFQEAKHRRRVWHYDVWPGWILNSFHQPVNFDSLQGLRIEDADNCCNRTAPIFALRGMRETATPPVNDLGSRRRFMEYFCIQTHNCIYNRWFQPYRSEIDNGQFLTRMNFPPHAALPAGTCSPALVDYVRKLSANLISRVKYVKEHEKSEDEEEMGQTLYWLRPLFQAVALSIRLDMIRSLHLDVAACPVLIVRTGIEEGLSAPITFDSIPVNKRLNFCVDHDGSISAVETSLADAITFLLELELREQAFGPRPDPKKATQNLTKYFIIGGVGWEAQSLGWNKSKMGPLNGPSSTWVDWKKHTTWKGKGRDYDEYLRRYEQTSLKGTITENARIVAKWKESQGKNVLNTETAVDPGTPYPVLD